MKREMEQAARVKSTVNELLQMLMKEQNDFNEKELQYAIELLARSVLDLANVYTDLDSDVETTLKATLIKLRVSYNVLSKGKHYRLTK
ncbi:hypothetical protein [Falsibacillus albus]|uniref:Group-specific protein n=1 Tax=Falsibacillus albus TaxID=2478915 RepID=A0A3L7K458_9BACI|nr:hypothetical protein [Falsibacillus albus]RLQ97084.1 hypothetical protein D9X91_02685 [Falsibacillus albus]